MGDPAMRVAYGKSKDRLKARGNQRKGVWQDGIFWNHFDLPCAKRIANPEKYGADIVLIQDGEQLYF